MATITAERAQHEGSVTALVLMLGAAVMLTYVDRGAIAIAAPLMKSALGLSATTFGLAVSAFFWSYAPLTFAIGWITDRLCVYRLFAAGVALWAAATLLTGWVGGLGALIVLRVLLGTGESIAIPGSSKIFAEQVPAQHRGLANAAVAFSLGFGPTVGTVAGGLILATLGWRWVFWVFGSATLVWLIGWHFVAAPFRAARDAAPPRRAAGYGAMLRTRALWTMALQQFCANYAFFFTLTWMPLYLVQARGYTIAQMTLLSSVNLLSPILAPFVGTWSDRLIARGISEDRVRRTMMIVALWGATAALIGTYVSRTTAELVFWAAFGGITLSGSGTNIFAVGQIFGGPRRAGSWIGVQNGCGNLAGIIGPVLTGFAIDRFGGFTAGFMMAIVVTAVGALCWMWLIPPIRPFATEPD